jgi:hypothetical protein
MGIIKASKACEKGELDTNFSWQVDIKYSHWYKNEVIFKGQRNLKMERILEIIHP